MPFTAPHNYVMPRQIDTSPKARALAKLHSVLSSQWEDLVALDAAPTFGWFGKHMAEGHITVIDHRIALAIGSANVITVWRQTNAFLILPYCHTNGKKVPLDQCFYALAD